MTELGFSLLMMMGYTGQRAIQWKRAYAEAFMAMRAELEYPVRILQYALSKNEAPVRWFLLNKSLHSTWISMSIHDIAANLRPSVGSDSTLTVAVALQSLVARNLLLMRQGETAGSPHSYYVNRAGVVDVLNQLEQKWLSFTDAGPQGQ